MDGTVWIVAASTISIAFFHALAPDHWMPFIMIGRAQKWLTTKLIWVTFLSGIGHVASSIVIGGIGLFLGFSLSSVEGWESSRGSIAILLLIGFGVAYALWGLKHARKHRHKHSDIFDDETKQRTVTVWTIFALFVLGPCEPLIPLMFLASKYGWSGVLWITFLFSIVTIAMMIGQTLLGYSGFNLVKLGTLDHYSHSIAGVVIALTGTMVLILGI
ncbi:MAG: hypothetical protein AB1756_10045 [Acidobacteriota bacterium]